MKQQNIVAFGKVTDELGNSLFRVSLDDSGHSIVCTISGKIRKNYIRILAGDRVKIEMSPYDLNKGRIVTRLKNDETTSTNNTEGSK